MSGYGYREFLEAVRRHRVAATSLGVPACWVCSMLGAGLLDGDVYAQASEYQRCRNVSGAVVDAHHLLPKRLLKDELPHGVYRSQDGTLTPLLRGDVGDAPAIVRDRLVPLDALLMDPRNGVLVRRYHHDALENGRLWVPKRLWPEDALVFARELGLEWWIDKKEGRRGGR